MPGTGLHRMLSALDDEPRSPAQARCRAETLFPGAPPLSSAAGTDLLRRLSSARYIQRLGWGQYVRTPDGEDVLAQVAARGSGESELSRLRRQFREGVG